VSVLEVATCLRIERPPGICSVDSVFADTGTDNFSPHFFTARIIVEVRLLHRYPNPKVSGLGELAA
jgi:hypothetical protein